MNTYDLLVIGAGPAGMMAAITASENGKSVLLVEKNETIGRKILATGNGRCNLTNRYITVSRYHGGDSKFIENILKRFDQHETMNFFENLGVALKEEDKGRIFPRTNQAATIVDALKHQLLENGVEIQTDTTIKSIEKGEFFTLTTEKGSTFLAKKLLIATGGKASYQFGSSGDGLFWAKNLGHTITPIHAALVPIEVTEKWVTDLQGIKLSAKVASVSDGQIIKETTGDVLFTHFGLSGPAIMSHSREISPLLEQKQVKLTIDLYPEMSGNELDKKVEEIFKNNPKKNLKNTLAGLFPAGLVPIIFKLSGVDENKNAAEASRQDREKIVNQIKNLCFTVSKIRPLKEAQVTRGGVATNEINSDTLESKIVKNLYFAGEIIDVDADSGGFNLQWAWSSGFVAGESTSK